jgi:hypothetical protein
MKKSKLESADILPIPALCPNRRYPVEICIGREDGRFIDYRKKSAGITSDNILEMILYPLHNLLNVEKGSPGLGVTTTRE